MITKNMNYLETDVYFFGVGKKKLFIGGVVDIRRSDNVLYETSHVTPTECALL